MNRVKSLPLEIIDFLTDQFRSSFFNWTRVLGYEKGNLRIPFFILRLLNGDRMVTKHTLLCQQI